MQTNCTSFGDKLVASSNGRVALTKMNIDEFPEISQQLQIQSIPAVLGFYNGQPVDGFVGVQVAYSVASENDVVLLSPASASFDNDLAIERGEKKNCIHCMKTTMMLLILFGRI